MTETNPAIFALPGQLTIGSREFVIAAPSPTDKARVHRKMKELATRSCVSPLVYVSRSKDDLDPVSFTEAIRAAVTIGSGGGVQPHREAVMDAYETLEGIRYRVWAAVVKSEKSITQKEIDGLVNDENYYEVEENLNKALGLDDVEKKAPSNGEK